ncbi:ParB/RepB/Spo0J family partition protein [Sulfuricystis multivorans]|uniref:ParB/RepB/Spo0J family partition protein n=1 Tax=Sulfuricystis multivorans TaxID=2211108 RepID=UPI000F821A03|nr:ParB N-terminal domain-containing protein [Sulfuricystis multivorans]
MKQRVIKRPDMPLAVIGTRTKEATSSTTTSGVSVTSTTTHIQVQPISPLPDLPGGQEVIDIPVSKLRVSPYNARRIRPPKRVSKIADSLKKNGQKDPLYVYPGVGDDEGYFMVLGGETRRLAALQIALPTLKAFVDWKVDPNDSLNLFRISNILNDSADECDLDRGMVAIDLLEKGYSQGEVAEVLGLDSRTHVQRLVKLASLPKRFIDFGQDYPERFSASLGAYINQAIERHGEDFGYDLLKAALVDELTHRRLAKAIEDGPSSRQAGQGRGKRLRRDSGFDITIPDAPGGRYDVYKSTSPGLKVLKLQVEIPDDLAKGLNEKLTEVLTKFFQPSQEQR